MKITSPRSEPHPDRFLHCQEAMCADFAQMAAAAVVAGWEPEEVAAALVELADNLMLGMVANRESALDLHRLGNR